MLWSLAMRAWLLGFALAAAACGGKASTPDPAWPASAGHVAPETWEEDGGESLEPRGDTMVEGSETDAEEGDSLQAAIDDAIEDQVTDPPAADDPDEDADEMIIVDDGDGDADDTKPEN